MPLVARFFGAAGAEYQDRFGMNAEQFAQVAVKSRRRATHNPFAVFTQPVTVADLLAALTGPSPASRHARRPSRSWSSTTASR